MIESGNLFECLPAAGAADEDVATLLAVGSLRLLRIVSTGQPSPAEGWYDQDDAEWVVVLKGSAGVRFEGEGAARVLGPGDYLHIPAHVRHRVDWTDPDGPTVWLALHHGG